MPMSRYLVLIVIGLLLGIGIGYFYVVNPFEFSFSNKKTYRFDKPTIPAHQVIGFLPYWLLTKANSDYSKSITQLAYFSLTPDVDGKIKKLDNPLEEEPGWFTLRSGKADSFLSNARKNKQSLSLVVFSGDNETIDQLVSDPVRHARNLLSDILPIMSKYHFSNLNLDIERVKEASPEARQNFTRFVAEVKHGLKKAGAGTLTIDITGSDLIKHNLVNPEDIGEIADFVMIMTYDFHYAGSQVTGPVAPLSGAGTIAEYDIEAAVQKALAVIPAKKIILGVPLYGYEWETIAPAPRSAVIPGSGITASNQRVEKLLINCSTCSAELDKVAQESYIIYKDQETNTYHQLFFPTAQATQVKVDFVTERDLAGVGLWALGYEGKNILNPLEDYIK